MNKEYAYSQNVSYFLYGSVILGVASLFNKDTMLPNIVFVASLLILAISSTILIYRKIKKQTDAPSDELVISEMVKTSIPMMMANSMLLVSGWINTIMLGIYSTEADVGIYSVVLKIATFSTFVLMSINAVATPRFAQYYARNDMDGLRKYTSQTAKVIFFSSVPIFLFIIIFNEWLLGLFGDEFKIGAMALLITMIGQLFNVFAGSVGAILNMTGHQTVFRNIIMISTLINVIACVILIPVFGLIGSALAGTAFMASWNLISMVYIRRKLKITSFFNPFNL
jgi:O-antigen/teichoic acid export membrane protein